MGCLCSRTSDKEPWTPTASQSAHRVSVHDDSSTQPSVSNAGFEAISPPPIRWEYKWRRPYYSLMIRPLNLHLNFDSPTIYNQSLTSLMYARRANEDALDHKSALRCLTGVSTRTAGLDYPPARDGKAANAVDISDGDTCTFPLPSNDDEKVSEQERTPETSERRARPKEQHAHGNKDIIPAEVSKQHSTRLDLGLTADIASDPMSDCHTAVANDVQVDPPASKPLLTSSFSLPLPSDESERMVTVPKQSRSKEESSTWLRDTGHEKLPLTEASVAAHSHTPPRSGNEDGESLKHHGVGTAPFQFSTACRASEGDVPIVATSLSASGTTEKSELFLPADDGQSKKSRPTAVSLGPPETTLPLFQQVVQDKHSLSSLLPSPLPSTDEATKMTNRLCLPISNESASLSSPPAGKPVADVAIPVASANGKYHSPERVQLLVSAEKTPGDASYTRTQSSKQRSKTQTRSGDSVAEEEDIITAKLSKEAGLLGVTLVGGTYSDTNMEAVVNLIPDGAAQRNGTLHVGDRIVSVNGISVSGKTEEQVVDLVRTSGNEVTLIVARSQKWNGTTVTIPKRKRSQKRSGTSLCTGNATDVCLPTHEMSSVGNRSDFETISRRENGGSLQTHRVRVDVHRSLSSIDARLGRVSSLKAIEIEKGPRGLGFSIAGGRSSSEGDLPIVVKTVFPNLPAEKSKRLLPKDQILKVNGQDFTVLTRSEAIKFCRSCLKGLYVCLPENLTNQCREIVPTDSFCVLQ